MDTKMGQFIQRKVADFSYDLSTLGQATVVPPQTTDAYWFEEERVHMTVSYTQPTSARSGIDKMRQEEIQVSHSTCEFIKVLRDPRTNDNTRAKADS
ncbi:unnamed protein product [Protopolystoma xenopodis]|uniref:Uncharacterized protein n=1 Tax=Protopolystoma xenopodis TaxID=117903 RepID=A0A448X0V8_9PLAT|nr:unnamed protein product [Protopolystoma xenopodis]